MIYVGLCPRLLLNPQRFMLADNCVWSHTFALVACIVKPHADLDFKTATPKFGGASSLILLFKTMTVISHTHT